MSDDLVRLPSLANSRVKLVPVADRHLDLIFSAAQLGAAAWPRMGLQGTPSLQAFSDRLWAGVLAQYVVLSTGDRPAGLVSIFRADHLSRVAWCDAVEFESTFGEDPIGLTAAEQGLDVLLNYAFKVWSFRKIYCETVAGQRSVFDHYGFALDEANLPGDTLVAGQYHDRSIQAIYSSDWYDNAGTSNPSTDFGNFPSP